MTHDNTVHAVAFSSDSKYIVSGSYDSTARVWEAASGKEVARMTHDDAVFSVAFSPDGKYIVSGSGDNTARVWEATSGKEVVRMTYDDSAVFSVAFSPDGKYTLSGSGDNTARVWVWQAEDLIANACKVIPRNLTRAEWQQYIGDALPYQAVCPNLPIEPKSTPTP
jgi:WD40 repeat protein